MFLGANFMVASTLNNSENESLPFFVKLTSDQRLVRYYIFAHVLTLSPYIVSNFVL